MRIMTLPCDGIGPEIMAATLDVLGAVNKKLGLDLTFEEEASGFESLKKHGITLREEVLDRARTEFDGIILGTQSHMDYPPVADGGRAAGTFRQAFVLGWTSTLTSVLPARAPSSTRRPQGWIW